MLTLSRKEIAQYARWYHQYEKSADRETMLKALLLVRTYDDYKAVTNNIVAIAPDTEATEKHLAEFLKRICSEKA